MAHNVVIEERSFPLMLYTHRGHSFLLMLCIHRHLGSFPICESRLLLYKTTFSKLANFFHIKILRFLRTLVIQPLQTQYQISHYQNHGIYFPNHRLSRPPSPAHLHPQHGHPSRKAYFKGWQLNSRLQMPTGRYCLRMLVRQRVFLSQS